MARRTLTVLAIVTGFAVTTSAQEPAGRLRLETCEIPGTDEEARCGTYTVYENRAGRRGRTIDLNLMVLPARNGAPKPDPIFYLAGGPGQGATRTASSHRFAWYREDRQVVLVDQRGTGDSNPLHCEVPGSEADPQSYFEPIFTAEVFEPCREELEKRADLTQYTTPIAMDDLNEVRAALDFDRINLMGGSYGTRAALVYMRRHPETVRSTILNGVAPIAFRNPLYHASEAQRVLERTLDECAADDSCHAAFPRLREEFEELIAQLEAEPAAVTIAHPATGEPVTVQLSRYSFAAALRTTMYYLPGARDVPFLIHRAYRGDFDAFATLGLSTGRAIVDALDFGMLLSVTCPEDVARIDPREIPALTDGTFLADDRVRGQMEACSVWPIAELPEGYGEPVTADVPTLLLSGTLDPVTSARWGEEAARHLPRSLHVVVPGAHGVGGACVRSIAKEFLEAASVQGLDTSCVAGMRLPPFRLSADEGR